MSLSSESASVTFDSGYYDLPTGSSVQTVFSVPFDLRIALGDMYDRYNTFAICLNSISFFAQLTSYTSINTPLLGTFGSSALVNCGMTGLPWINYTTNGSLDNLALFPPTFRMGGSPAGAYEGNTFIKSNCLLFRKPSNSQTTITVGCYVIRMQGALTVGHSSNNVQYSANYNFSIFGVK